MIKLLHAADFHLDSAFAALPPQLAAVRRTEQRDALLALTELAQGCDVVLLSGDLFDGENIYRESLEALTRFFCEAEAEIFLAAGNHDYLSDASPYRTQGWQALENVHLFTRAAPECIHLDRLNCDVYGASFTAPYMPALLRGFRVENPSAVNLMVLHGDLQPGSVYNPVTVDEIAATGLTYLALGHIHKRSVARAGGTTYAYPGCLIGRGFDECGPKGALRVTISENGCETEFVPLHSRSYETFTVDAGDDALSAVRAALRGHERDCCAVQLNTQTEDLDKPALEQALSDACFFLKLRYRFVPKRALWDGLEEDTLRGYFLRELTARYDAAAEEERTELAQAAWLGVHLMDGREVPL